MMNENFEIKKNDSYRTGLAVIILLALLTVGEYFIGSLANNWWSPLIAIALIKATLIMRDYMHVGRLFESEEV